MNSRASLLFIVIQAEEETYGIEKGVPMGCFFFLMKFGDFLEALRIYLPH